MCKRHHFESMTPQSIDEQKWKVKNLVTHSWKSTFCILHVRLGIPHPFQGRRIHFFRNQTMIWEFSRWRIWSTPSRRWRSDSPPLTRWVTPEFFGERTRIKTDPPPKNEKGKCRPRRFNIFLSQQVCRGLAATLSNFPIIHAYTESTVLRGPPWELFYWWGDFAFFGASERDFIGLWFEVSV